MTPRIITRSIATFSLAASLTLLTACGGRVTADFPDKTPTRGISLVVEPVATIPPPKIPNNCAELIPYTGPNRLLLSAEFLQLVQDLKGVLKPQLLAFNSCQGDSFDNISEAYQRMDGTYVQVPNARYSRLAFASNNSGEKITATSTYKDNIRLTTRLGVEDQTLDTSNFIPDDKLLDYATERIILPRDVNWQWSNRVPFQGARVLEGLSQSTSSRYSISNARGVYVEIIP